MSVDITIQETVNDVDITVNQNVITVSVTRTTGSGGVESVNGETGVVVLTTDNVNEGLINLYFTAARVRATVLTGISFVSGIAITATDTILSAFGKLQKQISSLGAVAFSNNYNDLDNKPTIPSPQNLAQTLAIDNKTNDIPIVSNNGMALVYVNDDYLLLEHGNNYLTLEPTTDGLQLYSDIQVLTSAPEMVALIDNAINYTCPSFTLNSEEVATQPYADAKVANDLTASTTVAPSKTAVNTALATKQSILEKYGTIYNKNTWADLSDFTNNGATVSVVSNKLSFTTLTSSNPVVGVNGQPPMLRLNSFTGLSRWVITSKVRINQVPSTTSYGFSIGLMGDLSLGNAYESAALAFFNTTTTGTLKGKISAMVGTQNNLVGSSTGVLTFSQNDLIELRIERILSNIVVSARNATTNSAIVSFSYDYNSNYADGTTNPFLPNSGNLVIGQHGGSFLVEEITFKSDEAKRANLMVISDSKGIYNAPQDLSFVSLLDKKYKNVVWNGGPIDITQGVVSRLPEIIALNPKQVVLAIGRNDLTTGISSATWQANLVTIDNALTSAGIAVYWTNGFKETTSQATLTSYIDSQFSGRVINTIAATDFAACLSADAIHPSVTGHEIIANTIIASGLIIDYSESPNNNQKSQSVQDLRFSGQILANNGTVQKPTTSNNGDIIAIDGSGLRAAYSGNPTWNGAVLPFVSGISQFKNTFSATNKYSFQFQGSGGTNGSEVTTAVLSDRGNLVLRPQTIPNPLLRTDFPTSGMYLTEVDKGLGSYYYPPYQSTVGQTGQLIPFTSTYATEIRNKSRIGTIDHYISGGTDDAQSLAIRTDSKGSTSFYGDGVGITPLTTTQRDAIGKVIGVSMIIVGSGITTATVAFTGGGGSGATGTVNISGGKITGVTITNTGSGYTSAPTATFSGDGTASSASCNVVGSFLTGGKTIYNTTTKKIEYWNETSWIESGTLSGSFSGVGTASTTFTVTIGQTMANTSYKVLTQSTSILALGGYVTNKTTTTFDYVLPATTGTVTFDWNVIP